MKAIANGFALPLICVFALIFAGCGESDRSGVPDVRVMLVAKDQAFHLEGKPEVRNPTITLKRGEIAELVLRNDDPSRVLHCLSISGLGIKTPSIDSGQTLRVTIRPTERGTLTYACLMHPPMTGKLSIQ